MGQALVDQVEASVEEAVNSATWTDLQVSSLTLKLIILEESHRIFLEISVSYPLPSGLL